MDIATLKNRVYIPKNEYIRLKKIDKRFGDLLAYLENLLEIRESRKQIKNKKVIPQEKLFKQLGF